MHADSAKNVFDRKWFLVCLTLTVVLTGPARSAEVAGVIYYGQASDSVIAPLTWESHIRQVQTGSNNALEATDFRAELRRMCERRVSDHFKSSSAKNGGAVFSSASLTCDSRHSGDEVRTVFTPRVFTPPATANVSSPHSGRPSQCTESPCDPLKGNRFVSEIDIDGDSTGLPFVRSYNSLARLIDLGMGLGWNHNYSMRVARPTAWSGGQMRLRLDDGKGVYLVRNPRIKGQWLPVDEHGLAVTESEFGFSVDFDNGSQWMFDLVGRLVSLKNVHGQPTTVAYRSDHRAELPFQATGPFGHTLTFDYVDGRLISVMDSDGQIFSYAYDATSQNRLVSVTNPLSVQHTFHYEDSKRPGLLTGIGSSLESQYAHFRYDEYGNAITDTQSNRRGPVTASRDLSLDTVVSRDNSTAVASTARANANAAIATTTLGGRYFAGAGTLNVEVYPPGRVTFESKLFLLEPQEIFIGENFDVGQIDVIGPFEPGTELVFGIVVEDTLEDDTFTYRMGPGDRNPDGVIHARVNYQEDGIAIVEFEDLFGGGDFDYDDFRFRLSPSKRANELSGLHPWGAIAGDPVQVATGNFLESAIDLSFGSAVFGMDLSRSYNSAAVNLATESVLGRGWRLSHNLVAVNESDGKVAITIDDGRVIRFAPPDPGSTTFSRPEAFYGDLHVVDDRYVVALFNGIRWYFDDNGRLAKMTSPNSQTVEILYDGSRIKEIQSSTGLLYLFSYNEDGLLDRVQATDGDVIDREIRYLYARNKSLKIVVDPDGGQMRYDTDDTGRITRVTDQTGILKVENTYDSRGRVSNQRLGTGESAEFIYDGVAKNTIVKITADVSPGQPRTDTFVYNHDDSGYVLDITDSLRARISTERRPEDGEPVEVRDRRANAENMDPATRRYDPCGNIIEESVPGVGTWKYTYFYTEDLTESASCQVDRESGRFAQHRLRTMTEPYGGVTRYFYTGTNTIPTRIEAPLGDVTENTIVDGLLTKSKDADGVVSTYQYDQNRRLRKVIDGVGNETIYTHDIAGRIIEVVDAFGRSTRMGYDESGRLLNTADRVGAKTAHLYDAAGRITEYRDPLDERPGVNSRRRYEYDPASGLPESITDQRSNRSTMRFNGFAELAGLTLPGGADWTYENAEMGRVASVTDPLPEARQVRFGYDFEGLVDESIRPDGTKVRVEYDQADRATKVTDPNGIVATRAYNQTTGQLISESYAVGTVDKITIFFGYDDANRISTVTGPRVGEKYTYSYTNAGRVKAVTDPRGNTVRYQYDAAGRTRFVTLPGERVIKYFYDKNGRVNAIDSPLNLRVKVEYDDEGRVIRQTTPAGVQTRFTYNDNGSMVSAGVGTDRSAKFHVDSLVLNMAQDPNGGNSEFHYDDRYNPTRWVDQNGNARRVEFDLADQPISATDPLNRVSRTDYDQLGRIDFHTDPSGRSIDTEYDDGGRLVNVVFGDVSSRELTYDNLNRVRTITDLPVGSTIKYDYDPAGNLTQVIAPGGAVTSYEWDLVGNLKKIRYPDDSWVEYDYDELDRLVAARHSVHGRTSYRYDDDSRLTDVFFPNGKERNYRYTGEHLTRFSDAGKSWHLSYDDSGRVKRINGAESWRFHYDDGGQLQDARRGYRHWHYDYDPVGNLLTVEDSKRGKTNYDYDIANQLRTSNTDGSAGTFKYDEAGRLTNESKPNGDKVTYDFDARGRLEKVSTTMPGVASFDQQKLFLLNAGLGRFLDADRNGQVDLSKAPAEDDQWKFVRLSNGYFALKNARYDRYLIVKDKRKRKHTKHSVSTSKEFSTQAQWKIIQRSDGTFLFSSRSSGGYLSAKGKHSKVELVDDRESIDSHWHVSSNDLHDDLLGQAVYLIGSNGGGFLDADADQTIGKSKNPRRDDVWKVEKIEALENGQKHYTLRNVEFGVSIQARQKHADLLQIRLKDCDRHGDSCRPCSEARHCSRSYWQLVRLSDEPLDPLSESWARTYHPDDLLATVTQNRSDGVSIRWRPSWDRSTLIPRLLGWEGPEKVTLIHGIGPALAVRNGSATPVELGPFGDVIGSSVAVSDNYTPFGNTQSRTFGLGYRGELHTGPTIYLKARDHNPELRRFLVTDPVGPAHGSAVTVAYAYADNDPMNLIDPSGLAPSDSDWLSFEPGFGQGTGNAKASAGSGTSRRYSTAVPPGTTRSLAGATASTSPSGDSARSGSGKTGKAYRANSTVDPARDYLLGDILDHGAAVPGPMQPNFVSARIYSDSFRSGDLSQIPRRHFQEGEDVLLDLTPIPEIVSANNCRIERTVSSCASTAVDVTVYLASRGRGRRPNSTSGKESEGAVLAVSGGSPTNRSTPNRNEGRPRTSIGKPANRGRAGRVGVSASFFNHRKGVYMLEFESGKKYIGSGPLSRMYTSARKRSKGEDRVVRRSWRPSINATESETRLIWRENAIESDNYFNSSWPIAPSKWYQYETD